MNTRIGCIVFIFMFSLTVFAQKRNINGGWTFQRLTQVQQAEEIKNQGTDWSSQYSVEHVSLAAAELRVSEDTLKREFGLLEKVDWESVDLPHSPFMEDLTVLHQWQGICYYKKKLQVTSNEVNSQCWLEFEGAMQLADVWLNGKHIMQHAGGYTPFVMDVTGLLKPGGENEVLVRLDNRDNPLIPPGKPLNTLDFCYFGGLYRDVNLIVKPFVYITDPILAERQAGGGLFITYPEVSEKEAQIRIQTEIGNKEKGEKSVSVKQMLFEWSKKKGKGKKVKETIEHCRLYTAETRELVQLMTLESPRLWFPDAPNLYVLCTEIIENGKVLDREETRIGIRKLEMTREKGFVINGKPIRLVGSNRHMEYPYIGNALSDNAQYRDMYQIRSNGFNLVRLGHYPQDVSVLDACDELGLLVIEPIPGWQYFNKASLFTELTYRDVRHLIRRDRNHPSIVMWETTLNEAWPPKEWKNGAVKVAHEEYPGNQCFTSGDSYGYEGFDVCYNDWEEGFKRPNKTSKPGFIREYYDYEFGGHYSTTRIRRGDGEMAQLQNAWNAQWSHNRYRANYPQTMGDAVWSMYDYNRGCCDNICYSGVADLFRLPKFSLSFFRTQIPAGSNLPNGKMPYEVFIPSYRYKELSDTVLVYGNVEEVELQLNGRTIERKHADNGPDTEYTPQADGGNCAQLQFPPFTFMQIPKEEGQLVAIGYVGGKKVASYLVRTPHEVRQMAIDYFEGGCSASKNDLLIIHVSLLDRSGTLCPLNDIPVALSVRGGMLVGPSVYPSENGIASFLVRTNDVSKLVLEATSGKMTQQRSIQLLK